MKADEFDKAFDNGMNVLNYLDLKNARRPGKKKHGKSFLPAWLIELFSNKKDQINSISRLPKLVQA